LNKKKAVRENEQPFTFVPDHLLGLICLVRLSVLTLGNERRDSQIDCMSYRKKGSSIPILVSSESGQYLMLSTDKQV